MYLNNKIDKSDIKDNVSIIQPFIPHYREEFFLNLSNKIGFDLFCVEKVNSSDAFNLSKRIDFNQLAVFKIGSMILFNPFSKKLLKNSHQIK